MSTLFSKRHYEWLAAYWRQRKQRIALDTWEGEVLSMAAALKREHTAFVTVRFLQACGMTRKEANALLEGATNAD